jgi:hypothetical protein
MPARCRNLPLVQARRRRPKASALLKLASSAHVPLAAGVGGVSRGGEGQGGHGSGEERARHLSRGVQAARAAQDTTDA